MTVPLGQALDQAQQIAALTVERDHYKRESDLGGAMLGVIVSGLGLGEKASSKTGANVKDVLDLVAGLKADVKALAEALDLVTTKPSGSEGPFTLVPADWVRQGRAALARLVAVRGEEKG